MWQTPQLLPSSCLLNDRWRQTVLSVGRREYTWLDAFLAAMLRGEWRPFERQLLEGLACFAAAGADRRIRWPDDPQIEAAANAFRYERDLIASDETIAWLDRAGLTFDAWTDYLIRRLLHDRYRDRLGDVLERSAVAATVRDIDFAAEGICSGIFDRFLRTMAGLAATALLDDRVVHSAVELDPQRIDGLRKAHHAWLGALDLGDVVERATHLAQLESAFHAQARAATTADALASQLACHRLEWTRVDLERVSFQTADAAREAVCCVRDDGLTLSEVAIESRQPVRDTRDLLERLEPTLRDAMLSAGSDELIGPVAVGSRHEVAWVVAKRPADLADPIVRARAETAVVDQVVARAILTHVRWADSPRAAPPRVERGEQQAHAQGAAAAVAEGSRRQNQHSPRAAPPRVERGEQQPHAQGAAAAVAEGSRRQNQHSPRAAPPRVERGEQQPHAQGAAAAVAEGNRRQNQHSPRAAPPRVERGEQQAHAQGAAAAVAEGSRRQNQHSPRAAPPRVERGEQQPHAQGAAAAAAEGSRRQDQRRPRP